MTETEVSMTTNSSSERITSVSIRLGSCEFTEARAHPPGISEGSFFVGPIGDRVQVVGTPDQMRTFAKALEDAAIEVERQQAANNSGERIDLAGLAER